jgi:hypothetical protein
MNEIKTTKFDENNWCFICYFYYTSDIEKIQHLNGKEHKKRVQNKQQIEELKISELRYCKYCLQIPSSSEQLEIHFNSASHKNQLDRFYLFSNAFKCNDYQANKRVNSFESNDNREAFFINKVDNPICESKNFFCEKLNV